MVQYVLDSIATQPVNHSCERELLFNIHSNCSLCCFDSLSFKEEKTYFLRIDKVWVSSICIGQIAVQLFSSNHRISSSKWGESKKINNLVRKKSKVSSDNIIKFDLIASHIATVTYNPQLAWNCRKKNQLVLAPWESVIPSTSA